ncbi:MAG: hypothetical protein U9R19_00935 [Bacteroidota bacterium]|nr:hypothetical protein [Bacteroidota bacterium]
MKDKNGMQKYVDQLIEDLEEIAAKPPPIPYIEPPPEVGLDRATAELALVPFKPIGEWVGISHEIFPSVFKLSDEQVEQINRAILKVYDSLKLELVDKPQDLPDEWFYDVLTDSWDEYVQYLPETGFDLELCSYDPQTCPYGDFCTCSDEIDFEEFDGSPPQRPEDIDVDELPF